MVKQSARLLAKGYYNSKGNHNFLTIQQRSKLESAFSNVLHLWVLTVFCFTNLRPREDNVRAQIKSRRAKLTSSEDKSNSYSFMNDYVFSGCKRLNWLSFVLCTCKSVRNIMIYTNLQNLSLCIGSSPVLLILTWIHRDVVSDLICTFCGWGFCPIVKMVMFLSRFKLIKAQVCFDGAQILKAHYAFLTFSGHGLFRQI